QNGEIDAALAEYEKLAKLEDNDPYHSVVIADLLYKKGDNTAASQRYLAASDGYETIGLSKNAIAVCKKMARLGLAPGPVFERLGVLPQRDGLGTESSLYWLQHAEFSLRSGTAEIAAKSFRAAFDASHDNLQALERLSEVHISQGDTQAYVATLVEAAEHYE